MKRMLLFMVFLLIFPLAFADSSPKPTLHIKVTKEGGLPLDKNFSARVFYCEADANNLMKLLEERKNYWSKWDQREFNFTIEDETRKCVWVMDQYISGRECGKGDCRLGSRGYHFPELFRLVIFLPSEKQVFISEPVKKTNFYSTFSADLNPDFTIDVRELNTFFGKDIVYSFFIALVITLLAELLFAILFLYSESTRIFAYLLPLIAFLFTFVVGILLPFIIIGTSIIIGYLLIKKREHVRFALKVILVNCLTLPVVWFIIPLLSSVPIVLAVSAVFAIVAEAVLLYFLNKKNWSLWKYLLFSLLMNLVSLIIYGLFFYIVVDVFFHMTIPTQWSFGMLN